MLLSVIIDSNLHQSIIIDKHRH